MRPQDRPSVLERVQRGGLIAESLWVLSIPVSDPFFPAPVLSVVPEQQRGGSLLRFRTKAGWTKHQPPLRWAGRRQRFRDQAWERAGSALQTNADGSRASPAQRGTANRRPKDHHRPRQPALAAPGG